MAGTRFSSTFLTSQGVPTEQIISRPSEFRFMPIAESAACTSPTDSTLKTSYQQNSNYICLCNRKNRINFRKLIIRIILATVLQETFCISSSSTYICYGTFLKKESSGVDLMQQHHLLSKHQGLDSCHMKWTMAY